MALATCAGLAELDPDEQLVIEPLRLRGVEPAAVVWDDPSIEWASFGLVVIRSTWDYTTRRDAFVAWARRVETVTRLANPADVIAWNSDKHYLADLAATGIPVVPTLWLEPGEQVTLPSAGRHVIKPTIGAGSLDAGAYEFGDPAEAAAAREHARRLLNAGQSVMLQPYLASIDEAGEAGLIFARARGRARHTEAGPGSRVAARRRWAPRCRTRGLQR